MSNTAPKTAPAPASFETALAELETIVATMEGGQLPLAEWETLTVKSVGATLWRRLTSDRPFEANSVERKSDRAAAWRRRFASLGGFRACREANSLRAFFGQKCDTFTICRMSLFALDVFQLDIVSITWLRRLRASARELYLAHGIFTAQLMRVTVHGQIGY